MIIAHVIHVKLDIDKFHCHAKFVRLIVLQDIRWCSCMAGLHFIFLIFYGSVPICSCR